MPAVLEDVGAVEERGIIPRAIEHIFDIARADASNSYSIYVSYVQIYCELVHDLLASDVGSTSLPIREDGEGGVYIEGVTKVRVTDPAATLACLAQGHRSRAVARTKYECG